MREAPVPDHSENIFAKLVALAGNEHQNVDTGDPIEDWYPLGRHDACPQPALEWRGPVAFARAYESVRRIDYDFGTRWGPNGEQRVILRLEVGDEVGLLYVYDPTWDEYAVLGTDVPLVAVQNALTRARQLDDHLTVEDFVGLPPNASAVRPPVGPAK